MPLFMDVHRVDGEIDLTELEAAHRKDVEVQRDRGVSYQRYWVDATQGRVFCLVEAPDADAAVGVHRDAHGMEADEIYEVVERT